MIHESQQARRPSSTRGARALLLAAAVTASLSACGGGGTEEPTIALSFVQQDQVMEFSLVTGAGRRAGTVTGSISGVSAVQFQWTPTAATAFTFDDAVLIVDVDGDQVRFASTGIGTFLTPVDLAVVSLVSELAGTYEVTAGDGKYVAWIGRTFAYRATGAIGANGLGSVFAEASSEPF